MKNYEQVVADLAKNGKATVVEATANSFRFVSEGERVSIYLDEPVQGFERQDDGTYKLGTINSILLYRSELTNAIKASGMANIASYLTAKESRLNLLMTGLKLGLVLVAVKESEIFKNPFSDKAKERVMTHETIIHLLFKVEKLPAKILDEIRRSILAD